MLGEAAVKYYNTGADKTQRFGQFFCNQYLPEGETWSELFYETDNFKAIQMILNRYFPQEME